MKFAGIDVGQSFHVINLPTDNREGKSKKIYCDQFNLMVSALRDSGVDAVILEPTGPYSPPLIRRLKRENFRVYYVHTKRFAEFRSQRESKNDKKDAKFLRLYAEYQNDEHHTIYEFTDRLLCAKELQNIHSLKIHYSRLLNSEINRLRQEIYQSGYEKESSLPIFQLLKFAEADYPETCDIIRRTNEVIQRKEKELIDYVEKHEEIKNMVEILESIPGFGFDLAVFFVTKVGEISRFTSYKELKSFCGFGSKTIQSGTSVKGKKNVRSHSLFKRYMYLFIMRTLKISTLKGKKNKEKAEAVENFKIAFQYYKKKTGGKGTKAIMIIAARVIKRIFHMLKNNVFWDPNLPFVLGGKEMLKIMNETDKMKKSITKGKSVKKSFEKGVENLQKSVIFVETS